jgi:hypothetical protein
MLLLHKLIDLLQRVERKLLTSVGSDKDYYRDVTLEDLSGDKLDFVTPYFVLSTGRCGTLWLSELLRLSSWTYVNHSEIPELIRHSRLAYEQYSQHPARFKEILRAARDEFIIAAYKHGKTYIETNNRITFFAYAIEQVYPKARFIHLIRHPGDFVRSGLSRGWYRNHSHDVGRIVKLEPVDTWQSMSDIEKVAWLWNETNRYIEDFLREISDHDYIQVKAESMFEDPSVADALCHFIGVDDITPQNITNMLSQKVNPQRKWEIGPYPTWSDDQKRQVRKRATLAGQYGYEL